MKAIVWSKPNCGYCVKSKSLLKNKGIEYEEKNIAEGHDIQEMLKLVPNARTMPQIWIDDKHIGGYDQLEKFLNPKTRLEQMALLTDPLSPEQELNMRPQSAKAKGRRLQQWTRDQLIEHLMISDEDVESRSMGAGGEDLIMAKEARRKFPYSIECKNVEKVNVWEAMEQAKANAKKGEPLVIIKRNNSKPLAIVDAEFFIKQHMAKTTEDL